MASYALLVPSCRRAEAEVELAEAQLQLGRERGRCTLLNNNLRRSNPEGAEALIAAAEARLKVPACSGGWRQLCQG